MITKIVYCVADCNMGETSGTDCRDYRAWADAELKKEYPDACISVYNSERSNACSSDLADFYKMDSEENKCLEFMAELWDRCPWSGEFFK